MHPLLDRRDLTAQREQPAAVPHGYDELCAELAQTNRLLRETLMQDRAQLTQLCVTDRDPAQAEMRNFPAPGARRLIVRRTGNGGLVTIAATPAVTNVLAGNEARLGGSIVNAGAGAVTLYLAADLLTPGGGSPLTEGTPQVWLGAGGSWDFRLGNLLWCGAVLAIGAAASSLSVAEV